MGNLVARFKHREARLIFLGLDKAGKTSILYRLKLDELVKAVPTIGFNVESIHYKDLHLTAWDIGSRDRVRPLFRHYYKGAEAVVIVIDSHDPERLDELNYDIIKPALNAEELTNSVFLFLANKIDLPNTMSPDEIAEKLGLRFLKHPWGILPVSAANGEGLQAALDWLAVRLGSSQVKPRNFTGVQPKPKLLEQCRTASSLSSSSSTATSKTDTSKPNSKVSIPSKPVILVNSKLYSDIMTTPTVSSGSVDNASLMSVSTPGHYYPGYSPRRTPGSVTNFFSSYSISQSMREDLSRRKFSTISKSDIRKMSCASLIEGSDNRKMSIGSLLDNQSPRKMSSASLVDSPYRRRMSSAFVIDAPPYRKFSSASLIEQAYVRKMSASSIGDGRLPDGMYARKHSASSLADSQTTTSTNPRRRSALSLGDSQDSPERPKMSYLAATPAVVATPPTTKRKSVDLSLSGFGKFSPIMADYVGSNRNDSDTSCESLSFGSSLYKEPACSQAQLANKRPSLESPMSFQKTIEAMKEEHYNEILSLLPESYTNMYYRDYFSDPYDKRLSFEGNQNLLESFDDDNSDVETSNRRDYNSNRSPEKKSFLKSLRQISQDSDSSITSNPIKGKRSHFRLFCARSRRSQSHSRAGTRSKERSPALVTASPKGPYYSRAYGALKCLFVKSNKGETRKETFRLSSEEGNKMKEKKETKVSFDMDSHNIKVEIVDVAQDKGDN